MGYRPSPLVPSGFRQVLPHCPLPAELVSVTLGDATVLTDSLVLNHSGIATTRLSRRTDGVLQNILPRFRTVKLHELLPQMRHFRSFGVSEEAVWWGASLLLLPFPGFVQEEDPPFTSSNARYFLAQEKVLSGEIDARTDHYNADRREDEAAYG